MGKEAIIRPFAIDENLQYIDTLQREFNATLGLQPYRQETLVLAYNPVYDRYNLSKIESREKYRLMVERQLETNLRERYDVVSSTFRINTIENILYPEYSNTQPLQDIYLQGVAIRKVQGSQEQEREQKEYEGFLEQQRLLASLHCGEKVLLISPPGVIEKTNYPKNFIDILEPIHDPLTSERYIKATRYTTTCTYGEYADKMREFNQNYFQGSEDVAADAWFLSHPIALPPKYSLESSDSIFENKFGGNPDSMKDKDFKTSIMTREMKSLISRYIDRVSQPYVDWNEVSIAFNAILNYGDHLYMQFEKGGTVQSIFPNEIFHNSIAIPLQQIDVDIDYWGRKKVRGVGSGCGMSAGFLVNDLFETVLFPEDTFTQMFDTTVAKFGMQMTDYLNDPGLCRCSGQEPHFHCPGEKGNCNHVIVVGKGISECPKCGQGKTC